MKKVLQPHPPEFLIFLSFLKKDVVICGETHVDLEHVVVLLLCDEGLLEHRDVLLEVGVLLLHRLHLGLHLHQLLLLPLELQAEVLDLKLERK